MSYGENYGEEIANEGLRINAIKLNTENPFTWASGFRMPIYNDNRMFLSDSSFRFFIGKGLSSLIAAEKIRFQVIAGTSTAGIPHATTLANMYEKPLIYIRDKPKDHGLRNQIEGIDSESDLEGKSVILIEDLISTGGSSVKAVQAIRDANGKCNYCFSIFNYGFDSANQVFYDLDSECKVNSLLTYDMLLEVAKEIGYIDEAQVKMLEEWREDPFGWGEKHGFPRVKE
tara:strand:- start:2049 stop:2735 length:687 start_codon:yes stop_codon:yes gene_type:complete